MAPRPAGAPVLLSALALALVAILVCDPGEPRDPDAGTGRAPRVAPPQRAATDPSEHRDERAPVVAQGASAAIRMASGSPASIRPIDDGEVSGSSSPPAAAAGRAPAARTVTWHAATEATFVAGEPIPITLELRPAPRQVAHITMIYVHWRTGGREWTEVLEDRLGFGPNVVVVLPPDGGGVHRLILDASYRSGTKGADGSDHPFWIPGRHEVRFEAETDADELGAPRRSLASDVVAFEVVEPAHDRAAFEALRGGAILEARATAEDRRRFLVEPARREGTDEQAVRGRARAGREVVPRAARPAQPRGHGGRAGRDAAGAVAPRARAGSQRGRSPVAVTPVA